MKKALLILVLRVTCYVLRVAVVFVAFQLQPTVKAVETVIALVETPSLINKDRLTIKSRDNIPIGYIIYILEPCHFITN